MKPSPSSLESLWVAVFSAVYAVEFPRQIKAGLSPLSFASREAIDAATKEAARALDRFASEAETLWGHREERYRWDESGGSSSYLVDTHTGHPSGAVQKKGDGRWFAYYPAGHSAPEAFDSESQARRYVESLATAYERVYATNAEVREVLREREATIARMDLGPEDVPDGAQLRGVVSTQPICEVEGCGEPAELDGPGGSLMCRACARAHGIR